MIRRFIRLLTGHGRREELADRLVSEHRANTDATRRALKARVNALERLVEKLREDTVSWR